MNVRSTGGRLLPLAAVGAVVAGLAGFVCSADGTEPRSVPPAPCPRPTDGPNFPGPTDGPGFPGPRAVVAGVPAGFARTEEGAVAAAASYVTTGNILLGLDPLAVEAAVRQMASDRTAAHQIEEAQSRLSEARSALAAGNGPVHFRQASIAARLEDWSPQGARVAVWNVGVLSRAGVAPPQAGWAISTLELVWEHDDWKILAETITPGPAPIPNASASPATSEQFAAALVGFVDLDDRR